MSSDPSGPAEAGTGAALPALHTLLPDEVVVAARRSDADEAELFPAELEVISRAVTKRRAEFTAVRSCARTALAQLGIAPVPILPGPRGAPQWPDGVVGSMTHCAGYRAAALGSATAIASIGIDAEPHGPLPEGVLGTVARAEEHVRLAELAATRPGVHWDRLLFSIKESVYKTWFPLTGRWLDFDEASIRIDPAAGTFDADLLVPGPVLRGRELAGFTGRFLISDGLVLSAIAVRCPAGDGC